MKTLVTIAIKTLQIVWSEKFKYKVRNVTSGLIFFFPNQINLVTLVPNQIIWNSNMTDNLDIDQLNPTDHANRLNMKTLVIIAIKTLQIVWSKKFKYKFVM